MMLLNEEDYYHFTIEPEVDSYLIYNTKKPWWKKKIIRYFEASNGTSYQLFYHFHIKKTLDPHKFYIKNKDNGKIHPFLEVGSICYAERSDRKNELKWVNLKAD